MPIKQCPYCAEDIDDRAIKCKHCGSMLDQKSSPIQTNDEVLRRKIIDEVEERNRVKKAYKVESYKNIGKKAVNWYLKIWVIIGVFIVIMLIIGFLASLSR